MNIEELKEIEANLTDEEKRGNAVKLAFSGDRARFEEFCKVLSEEMPPNTTAVLGGSSITGYRFKDARPFDAEGPMTSDLDITLVGPEAIEYFSLEGFWIPGIHSHPVKEGDDDIAAPKLKKLRHRLQTIAGGRPVTIQASRDFYYRIREGWLGQPYLTLVEKPAEE